MLRAGAWMLRAGAWMLRAIVWMLRYGGRSVVVWTLADAGEGSLREALRAEEALWITFGVSGAVNLTSDVEVEVSASAQESDRE
eukprot:366283-Prorocentrum_minimum.AAC.1